MWERIKDFLFGVTQVVFDGGVIFPIKFRAFGRVRTATCELVHRVYRRPRLPLRRRYSVDARVTFTEVMQVDGGRTVSAVRVPLGEKRQRNRIDHASPDVVAEIVSRVEATVATYRRGGHKDATSIV